MEGGLTSLLRVVGAHHSHQMVEVEKLAPPFIERGGRMHPQLAGGGGAPQPGGNGGDNENGDENGGGSRLPPPRQNGGGCGNDDGDDGDR